MDDSPAKVVDQYEIPEMMNIWRTAFNWMNAGCINKDAATTADETLWDQGKAFARPQWGIGVLPTWINQGETPSSGSTSAASPPPRTRIPAP